MHNTQKAAEAVTHIENKIGFDPGSIAKLVDFVKTAAEKDLELSKKAVSRDESAIKKMEIAGTTRQREMGTNVALNDAKDKLKTDQDILKETKDRLEKIKQMELIVTEIEAAKFSALNRAGHNQYEKKIEWNSAARRRSFKTSP